MANMSGYARLAAGAKNLGKAVWSVPTATFGALFGSVGTAGAAGGAAGGMAVRATNGAVGMAAGLTGRMLNGTAAVIRFAKVPIGLGALFAGGMMVKGHFDRKRETALNNYAMQEQMRYMNSTSPQDYALMQERLRGAQPGQGGMADKLMSDRAAAAEAAKQ